MSVDPCRSHAAPTLNASRRRRIAYSVAAGAVAAGTSTEANADIVYSGIQNINIGQFGSLNLDLDEYGVSPDIKLKNYVFGGGNYMGATAINAPGKLVLSNSTFPYYVTALNAGDPINASTLGVTFYGSMAYGAVNPSAEFNNVTDAYIGLSFPTGPSTYFGWVRVDVNRNAGTFLVKDWAYQTVPNLGLSAGATVPEPGTLGMLAAGAIGVAALRRRQRRVAELS